MDDGRAVRGLFRVRSPVIQEYALQVPGRPVCRVHLGYPFFRSLLQVIDHLVNLTRTASMIHTLTVILVTSKTAQFFLLSLYPAELYL
jgi:hypothetical protein